MSWTPVCVCVHVSNVCEDWKLPFRQPCAHVGRASASHLVSPAAQSGVVPSTPTLARPPGPHFGQIVALLQEQEDAWYLSLLCSVAEVPLLSERTGWHSLWGAGGAGLGDPCKRPLAPRMWQALQKPAQSWESLSSDQRETGPIAQPCGFFYALHSHRDLWSHTHSDGQHPVSLNSLSDDQGREMIREVPFMVVSSKTTS